MRIFIFGANGMLGRYCYKYLRQTFDVMPITKSNYDLSKINIKSLKQFLSFLNLQTDDIIINCAGVIPQRKDVTNELYYKINSIFPLLLDLLCDCKIIHITTDCVFDGKKLHGKYDELSQRTETNDYGVSKYLGELSEKTCIIRTSIIGEEYFNKKSLLEWIKSKKNEKIKGFTNHYWNGVTCFQLAKIIKEIIENNLFWEGIRHIFSPEIISKYYLACCINEIYKLNIEIEEYATEKEIINKSLSSIYVTNNLFSIPSIYHQIKEQKDFGIEF